MGVGAGGAVGLTRSWRTHSPRFYLHVVRQPEAAIDLPQGHAERAAYIAKGRVAAEGHVYSAGQMLVFGRDAAPTITAEEPATIMLIGGEPLGERFIWWTFVSSRRQRNEQAKPDRKAGRIALQPNDNAAFTPIPNRKGDQSGPSVPVRIEH